ncbi:MAG TPA: hypothetical protein VHH73_04420 [Verrucomicrobiae bacterium]|nr:hypothetical protein [Verrucomicrobiae bacterium]
MIDWNIQSRAHACQACAKPFADKTSYHTLLFDERQSYARLDVCEACWTGQYSQGATERKGFISHWQGLYLAPPAQAPDPIQKDTAESLLRKLIELNDPKHAAACYILAVMLERKRILKVQSQLRQGGRRLFVYEHARNGDVFTIADPDLQLNQLEAVQRDVAQLLEHGLNPAPAPATAPAAEAAPASGAAPASPGAENQAVAASEENPATPTVPAGQEAPVAAVS